MDYSWIDDTRQKYSEEKLSSLIKQQTDYEDNNQTNNCPSCGWKNEGTIVEVRPNQPILIHYGSWLNNRCETCNKQPTKRGN